MTKADPDAVLALADRLVTALKQETRTMVTVDAMLNVLGQIIVESTADPKHAVRVVAEALVDVVERGAARKSMEVTKARVIH
jgi:hypothetical protein